jgi:hypothetical protein
MIMKIKERYKLNKSSKVGGTNILTILTMIKDGTHTKIHFIKPDLFRFFSVFIIYLT